MTISLDVFSESVPGSVHGYEDRVLVDRSKNLFAVADGVTLSSRGSGAVAAELAVRLLRESFSGDLVDALKKVQEEVVRARTHDLQIGETTLTAASIEADISSIANVGDSPAYLVRRGRMQRLDHPDKSIFGYITQVIGYPEKIEVHATERKLRELDCLLLASDGMTHVMNQAIIVSHLRRGPAARDLVYSLMEEARTRQAAYDDDKSLVVILVRNL